MICKATEPIIWHWKFQQGWQLQLHPDLLTSSQLERREADRGLALALLFLGRWQGCSARKALLHSKWVGFHCFSGGQGWPCKTYTIITSHSSVAALHLPAGNTQKWPGCLLPHHPRMCSLLPFQHATNLTIIAAPAPGLAAVGHGPAPANSSKAPFFTRHGLHLTILHISQARNDWKHWKRWQIFPSQASLLLIAKLPQCVQYC